MANLNQSQLQVWRTELDTDPLGRGYAGMTDEQAAESGNALDIASTQIIPTSEWELAIRKGGKWTPWRERAALQTVPDVYDNPAMQEIMSAMISATTEVDLRGDPYWSGLLDTAVADGELGAQAAELMKQLCDITISRATELGLPTITTADTTAARAL